MQKFFLILISKYSISLFPSPKTRSQSTKKENQHVYHFWESALYQTDDLIALVQNTPINLEEREKQKARYLDPKSTALNDGFATLYLNRVNYSGVLFAGPLGGRSQSSAYGIGCRFNKESIIQRIRDVGALHSRIRLYNYDANDLIIRELARENIHCFYNIQMVSLSEKKRIMMICICKNQREVPPMLCVTTKDLPRTTRPCAR